MLFYFSTKCQCSFFFFAFFCQSNMFAKICFLSYGKKRHNAGFFKPQYLTKNLRYEIEFLDMIKGPRKH